ncbi:MAG TPA: hypothetical protein VG897_07120, partial [Terriglobales bacterium]|nr:hypothetical protein [Terriglobales bacterium]
MTRFGATVQGDKTAFRVWASNARKATLRLLRRDGSREDLPMQGVENGEFYLTADAHAGDRYFYLLNDDSLQLPDPVSRLLPKGVHGPTEIVDPAAFNWTDHDWHGVSYRDYVIYELHIGT